MVGPPPPLPEEFYRETRNPGRRKEEGAFNNVISPKDLEFLRRIGNKLMQLSLDRGRSRVDERGGVGATNFFFLYPFPSFLGRRRRVATQSRPANDFAFSSTHCRHSTFGDGILAITESSAY